MKYAAKTEVNSERSRNEIERTLARYGAHSFMYGTSPRQAVIAFEMRDRRIRFDLPLPEEAEFRMVNAGARGRQPRSDSARKHAHAQAVRQRWRALALMIKAKLEAVESGITEFQEEFLAHIVLPDGSTVGQHLLPQIARSYETGHMPPLLPSPH